MRKKGTPLAWSVALHVEPDPDDPGVHQFSTMWAAAAGPNEIWHVSGRVLNQDGVLVIGSLTIEPSGGTPPGGIDTQMLRGLPLGAYREQLVARVAQRLVTRPEQAEKLAGLAKAKPPRGRPASVDDDHRATALAYLAAQRELTEAGQPLRGLNKLLAARAGVDEETMRTRIKVSTKGEWLGPGRQGRAGRSPGRRLLDWIQEGN